MILDTLNEELIFEIIDSHKDFIPFMDNDLICRNKLYKVLLLHSHLSLM